MVKPEYFYSHLHALLVAHARINAFAVLSPQLTVRQNIRAFLELENTGTTNIGFPANVEKAKRCLAGEDLVRGPKVTAFRDSIRLRNGAICVDRHILRWAGCGDAWTRQNVEHAKQAVREVSRRTGLRTFEAQALIWHSLATPDSRHDPRELWIEEASRWK
jgi:hypothetical protein